MTETMTETLNDEAMTNEPVRPIRALLRGLEALHALNRRDGLTVTEVAEWAKLPGQQHTGFLKHCATAAL